MTEPKRKPDAEWTISVKTPKGETSRNRSVDELADWLGTDTRQRAALLMSEATTAVCSQVALNAPSDEIVIELRLVVRGNGADRHQ